MPECVDCGNEYTLDDGCESDGWCHPCAHAVADSRNSAMVSARDLTIRALRTAAWGLLDAIESSTHAPSKEVIGQCVQMKSALGSRSKAGA
jgi:hypothetical protein